MIDILQMFRIITFSIQRLAKDGVPIEDKLAERLRFRGFDHNDALEGHMARYVRYQMRDENRWQELQPQAAESDNGNSHMPILAVYMRMLTEYRRIMRGREGSYDRDDYLLSAAELQRIEEATIHPSHRG